MKKGLFSIDAAFAAIILLTISLFFYFLSSSILSSLNMLDKRQKTVSLIVFSNEIVRKEGAYKTNTETISNVIHLSELDMLSNKIKNLNASEYGFEYVEWSLYRKDGSLVRYFNKTFTNASIKDVYCINRFVIIKEDLFENVGILKICAG